MYFTHGHWDHTLDGAKFNDAGIPVFANMADKAFF
jgi:glyoxylase-like metal-dependent hydrolase (beta-lactamase superfamily II)